MHKNTLYSAVILAGGSSSRMKTNKALLELNGKTIIQIIVDTLRPIFNEIIIISNNPQQYSHFNLPIYSDIFLNQGPLAGIHSGLKHISTGGGFFVACDMPFLNASLARELVEFLGSYQAVVPKLDKYLQPLHAAYRKDCLDAVEKTLQTERPKIISFYDLVNIKYYDFKIYTQYDWNKIFFNVNTPDDYAQARGL